MRKWLELVFWLALLVLIALALLLGPFVGKVAAQDIKEPVLTFETTGQDQVTMTVEGLTGACRLTWLEEGETFTQDILDERGWGEGDCAADWNVVIRPSEWRMPGLISDKYISQVFLVARPPNAREWNADEVWARDVSYQVFWATGFGRVALSTDLIDALGGGIRLGTNTEFFVLAEREATITVKLFVTGEVGKVQAEDVELAVSGDHNLREYASGLCLATPEATGRYELSWENRRWSHYLRFGAVVNLDGVSYQLWFNERQLEMGENARLTEPVLARFDLSSGWVARHSINDGGLGLINRPVYWDLYRWQLRYSCQ